MAMSMSDTYYGASEPTWLVSHERHVPTYSRQVHRVQTPYTSYTHHGVPMLEFFVPMCCSKCEEKVREELFELRGVENVMIDQQLRKVIVTGFVDPLRALKKVKKVKKKAEMWSAVSSARHGGGYGPSEYLSGEKSMHHQLDRAYRTSYNRYTPSYGAGQSSYYHPPSSRPSYSETYSQIVTNPHYMKHIESEY